MKITEIPRELIPIFNESRLNAANSRLWETSRDLVKSYKIGWSLFPRKQFSVVSFWMKKYMYSKTSNIRRTWICNEIVHHSDVVGASPVGAVTTSSASSSTWYLASMDWTKKTARRDKKHLKFGIWCVSYYIFYGKLFLAYSFNMPWV